MVLWNDFAVKRDDRKLPKSLSYTPAVSVSVKPICDFLKILQAIEIYGDTLEIAISILLSRINFMVKNEFFKRIYKYWKTKTNVVLKK